MLTKEQKKKLVAELRTELSRGKTIILVEFSRVKVSALSQLRSDLKRTDTKVKIIKKRLFNILAKDLGLAINLNKSAESLAVIVTTKELIDIASLIYKFSKVVAKEKGVFSIKLVFDLSKKEIVSEKTFNLIATLPSKEVLLAQLVGMISAPIRSLLFVLKAKSEKK